MTEAASFEAISFGLHQGDSSGSQLIIRAQRGDPAAFQELVHSYEAMLLRMALLVTGRQDSAQEIYVRVFRDAFASMNKLEAGTSVFVWLYRILVKHCVEYCRRNRGYFQESGSHPLTGVLHTLSPTERVVFLLKHYQRLRIGTVAEIFACSPEHIAKVLHHATMSLRAQLKPQLRQNGPSRGLESKSA